MTTSAVSRGMKRSAAMAGLANTCQTEGKIAGNVHDGSTPGMSSDGGTPVDPTPGPVCGGLTAAMSGQTVQKTSLWENLKSCDDHDGGPLSTTISSSHCNNPNPELVTELVTKEKQVMLRKVMKRMKTTAIWRSLRRRRVHLHLSLPLLMVSLLQRHQYSSQMPLMSGKMEKVWVLLFSLIGLIREVLSLLETQDEAKVMQQEEFLMVKVKLREFHHQPSCLFPHCCMAMSITTKCT